LSATSRTIQVIELLARRAPLGVRDIARELDLPLGSTHRILTDLNAEEIVERNDRGEWELSYRLLQIVGIHLDKLSLPRLVRPHLEQLAADTHETAFLAVPSKGEIVHLDKVELDTHETDMHLRLSIELGARRPMYCTGLGKAMLAFLPPAQQEQYLPSEPFPRYTPNTITDPDELKRELQRTRERGYATDREETIIGMQCIAVPILNHFQQPVAAISIVGNGLITDEERFPSLVSKMSAVGTYLSRRLGMRTEQYDEPVEGTIGAAVPPVVDRSGML
jgi:IclR family acetate operon transcriptional repressor